MARRRTPTAADPFVDLAKKIEILEREMAIQRAAMDRLKEQRDARTSREDDVRTSARKSA